MNVEIGTETPIFLFWEYLFQNFGILSLQCKWDICFKISVFCLCSASGINELYVVIKLSATVAVKTYLRKNYMTQTSYVRPITKVYKTSTST